MNNKRIVERKEADQWIRVDFKSLKKGDTFRLFDPPDMTLLEYEGHTVWIATADAYEENNVGYIKVELEEKI